MVKLMVRFPNHGELKEINYLVRNHSNLEKNAFDIWKHMEAMKLRLFNKLYNSRTVLNSLKPKTCML